MVNAKLIGIGAAAVILVVLVSVYGVSYMADFENARPTSNDDDFKSLSLTAVPMLGYDDAPITIVEVGDYQCHMCKKWFEETRPLIIENYVNTGKVNLVFLDMPFLGADSIPASEATYCANDQGKYWEYHSMLFRYQQEIDDGWANANRLQAIALNLDLDIEQFDKCMTTDDHKPRINFNRQKSVTDFDATSTPTFMIIPESGNSERIVGAHPYSTFERIINSML